MWLSEWPLKGCESSKALAHVKFPSFSGDRSLSHFCAYDLSKLTFLTQDLSLNVSKRFAHRGKSLRQSRNLMRAVELLKTHDSCLGMGSFMPKIELQSFF